MADTMGPLEYIEYLRGEQAARVRRLEDIAVLLAVEASRGMGQSGQVFYDFIDAIRAERNASYTS